MPRPPKTRQVSFFPPVTRFIPDTLPETVSGEIILSIDQFEAIRLKDYLVMNQEECATRMNLTQSTLQRILTSARTKLAAAIVEGKAIRIEGGNYRLLVSCRCRSCGYKWEAQPDEDNTLNIPCPSCGVGEPNYHNGFGWGPPPWAGRGRRRRGR